MIIPLLLWGNILLFARSGREVDTNLGYRLHNPVHPEGDTVDYYLDNTSRFGRVLEATDFLYNNCNQNIFLLFCIYTGSWFTYPPVSIILWGMARLPPYWFPAIRTKFHVVAFGGSIYKFKRM